MLLSSPSPLVEGHFVDQLHDAGDFVEGEAEAAVLANQLAGDVREGDDGGGDDFAAGAGGLAIDLHFAHALDLQDDGFDFARVDLLSGGVDQIAGAAGERDLAVSQLDEIVGDEDGFVERMKGPGVDQMPAATEPLLTGARRSPRVASSTFSSAAPTLPRSTAAPRRS